MVTGLLLLLAVWTLSPKRQGSLQPQPGRTRQHPLSARFGVGQPTEEALGPVVLLIDGDQVGPKDFGAVVAAARTWGRLSAAHCFGAPAMAVSWEEALTQHGLRFQAVQRSAMGSTEPNDLAIRTAALHLAAEAPTTCLAIASGDGGFLALHRDLQQSGVHSLALVPHESLAARMRAAGASAVVYTDLEEEKAQAKAALASAFHKMLARERPGEAEADAVVAEVKIRLTTLGYLKPEESRPAARALTLFFHQNAAALAAAGLSGREAWLEVPLLVAVFAAHLAMQAAEHQKLPLLHCPSNLRYFETRGQTGGSRREVRARGAGPFVAGVSESLVPSVLRHLGFLQGSSVVEEKEAIEAFWLHNAARLRANLKGTAFEPLVGLQVHPEKAVLHQILAAWEVRQDWRVVPRDAGVRARLCGLGLLSSAFVSQEEVMAAMHLFLETRSSRPPPTCYALALRLVLDELETLADPLFRGRP